MRKLLIGLAGFFTACGGCGGVALDELPTRAASGICSKVYECCTAAEVQDAGSVGPDRTACEATQKASYEARRNLISSEQTKGRLVYHPEIAAQCVAELAAKKCQEMKSNATSGITACDTYLEPKVALGGACVMSESCVGGHCSGASLTADGVCKAFAQEGASCANDLCAAGLYCDGTKCAKPKADGTTCSVNFECATGGCNGRNPDAGTPGTCGLKGGPGSTCFVTSGCSSTGGGSGGLVTLGLALLGLFALGRAARRTEP